MWPGRPLCIYLARRVLGLGVSLLVTTIALFAALSSLPGTASTAALGLNPTPAAIKAFNVRYGLDRSLVTQYIDWISGALKGNFGQSYQTNVSITDEIWLRTPVTLELTVLAAVVALIIAIPLAAIAASRRGSGTDVTATSVSLIGLSLPAFATATALVLVFSLKLHWVPPGGFVPFASDPAENVRMMVLPSVSLGVVSAGLLMRIFRSGLSQALDQEYVLASRSRGATNGHVMRRHAMRVAAIPLMTVGAMEIGAIFGGSVVIEQIFQLPGLGSLVLQGIANRDFRVLQAAAIVIATFVMIANLVVDLIAATIDPRLRGVEGA
jgi:peptide/nickel transport system permease protein